jgi:hypothetical protein
MRFTLIPRERVGEEWARILALIAPAIGYDRNATPEEVRDWLRAGWSEAFWIEGEGVTGVAVTTTDEETCFINYVGGRVEGGPRTFVKAVRAVVDEIENLARAVGCRYLRLGGRDWSCAFPEWEHEGPQFPNRMRKVIGSVASSPTPSHSRRKVRPIYPLAQGES